MNIRFHISLFSVVLLSSEYYVLVVSIISCNPSGTGRPEGAPQLTWIYMFAKVVLVFCCLPLCLQRCSETFCRVTL